MTARKFRKRPVVVEALRYTEEAVDEILEWLGRAGEDSGLHKAGALQSLVVNTLEGDLTASPGDWIIRGVQGEFYACKPGIFESTFEPADG
jgi:hypothetical protein